MEDIDDDLENNNPNKENNDLDNNDEIEEEKNIEQNEENNEEKEVDNDEGNDEEKDEEKGEEKDEDKGEDKGEKEEEKEEEDKDKDENEEIEKDKEEENDADKDEDEVVEDVSRTIKLKSSDGEMLEIKDKYLKRVKFFEERKENLNLDEEITLNEIDSKTLNKIIEFLMHYETEDPKKIPRPLPGHDLKTFLPKWDYNYISQISLEEAIALINAANYLNIDELVNLACAKIGVELINCPIEEAREKFGVKGDFTEEELKEMDKYSLE